MMTDKLTSNIFVVFCLLVILTMFAVAFNKAMALPTVYFSWSTGECTAVDNYTDTDTHTTCLWRYRAVSGCL